MRAASAAEALARHGAGPGYPIAALTESTEVLAILSCAAPMVGGALFPLDPHLPEEFLQNLLAAAGVKVIVSEREFDGLPHVPAHKIAEGEPSAPLPFRYTSDSLALLIATSGSSARPKAVMLSDENLRASAEASLSRTPLGKSDRWLVCLPLFHIGGFSVLTRCRLAGADAVLQQGFDPERVNTALSRQHITHLSLVPAMLALLLESAKGPPPPALRHVLVGGAALSPNLAAQASELGWPIQPTYGMSETASQVATLPALPRSWRAGLVGRPFPGVSVALNDDGRLKIKGPMVMAGYANPAGELGHGLSDGWFQTNDLAELTESGELIILGRADDVITSGGTKVQPAAVEDLVRMCPAIRDVAIVGRQDRIWGEIVVAVFSGEIGEAALLDWCRNNIPSRLRPRAAISLPALPALANGKPDRRALRDLASRHNAETGAIG